jgi:hypothetical protein
LSEYTDESGNVYPARRYRVAQATERTNAVYRLGPSADILADGHVAMPLTDSSYLLVTPAATHVIEQQAGRCVMSLRNDPTLLNLTTAEISRQLAQLSQAVGQSGGATETAVHYLSKAEQVFRTERVHPFAQEAGWKPALPVEIFPSVCLTADGQYLVITRVSGQTVYLDGKNWYCDLGNSPLSEAYPEQFRSIAVSYLGKLVRNANATTNMLQADKQELAAYIDMLAGELSNYEASADSTVSFGTRKLAREEAIRLTQLAMRKAQRQIQALDKHIAQLPANVEVAKIALANVSDQRKA